MYICTHWLLYRLNGSESFTRLQLGKSAYGPNWPPKWPPAATKTQTNSVSSIFLLNVLNGCADLLNEFGYVTVEEFVSEQLNPRDPTLRDNVAGRVDCNTVKHSHIHRVDQSGKTFALHVFLARGHQFEEHGITWITADVGDFFGDNVNLGHEHDVFSLGGY